MDINKVVQRYRANREAALQRALAAGQLGDEFAVGQNHMRGRGPARGRGKVPWAKDMVQGVGRGRNVRGRGPVGQSTAPSAKAQQASLALNYEGYPGNHCAIDVAGSMPTGMGCEDESPCGVNVIGGNTLGTVGIAPGTTGTVTITAGDAGYFQPRAIYWEALPLSSNDLVDPAALPSGCCVIPSILVDAAIGRVSMLRRGGSPDRGLTQGGFANTKELVAVDWGEFVSTNEQNLTLFFYNPNVNIVAHVFVDLWGNI